jgi:hypothetical protein
MKIYIYPTIIFLILAALLVACNYPGLNPPPATPTTIKAPAAQPTQQPTVAAAPPLATATLAPIATLPPPPTHTQGPPPTMRPTDTRAITATPLLPVGDSKFLGIFSGGKIVLRVNDKGTGVTLKELVLSGATCNNGKKVSTRFDFTTPVYAPIESGRFTISMGEVTVNGYFNAPPTSAGGTVSGQAKTNKGNCTFGPISWTATIQ